MMTWNEHFDNIQPGDVFVKDWGQRQLVHVMLPRTPKSAKQPYMILSSGGRDSTWCTRRSSYGNTTTDRRWRYVGQIPAEWLSMLIGRGTLRVEIESSPLALYYEGGTVDRHWLAPKGLSLTEAKKQRVGKLYRTRWPAMRALSETLRQ
jgi:hypothetical protein